MVNSWFRNSLAAIIVCGAQGCSASERIATEANSIGERASTIERLAEHIGTQSKEADTVASAAAIVIEAKAIERATQEIHAALPGVSDTHPYLNVLKWVALAIAVLAVAWIIHSTGISTAVRVAVGWIPRKQRDAADMMVSTLRQDKPETVRELVAMLRSQDPLLDQAMRQIKQDTHT